MSAGPPRLMPPAPDSGAALDALCHGADPDAATLPTHSREVADRWAFD